VSGPSTFGTATYTLGPVGDGGDFAYGCKVQEGNAGIFTGWRTVATGVSGFGGAIPVGVVQSDVTEAVDVVFIADGDSYQPTEAEFIEDVGIAIRNGYFAEPLFLPNQTKFNFWIFPNTGAADREYDVTLGEDGAGDDTCSDGLDNGSDGFTDEDDVNCTPCILTPPAGWNTLGAFADVGPIFHTDPFRDCAKGGLRLFSTEPTSLRTMVHETGHTPFGLSDEYCCNTGYFQPESLPNLYSSLASCENEAPAVGKDPSDCRQLSKYDGDRTEDPGASQGPCDDGMDNGGDTQSDMNDPDCIITRNWWTSDPASNDLMVDNKTPQALDRRRINWLFGQCDQGKC
jgi:hypothetical protein